MGVESDKAQAVMLLCSAGVPIVVALELSGYPLTEAQSKRIEESRAAAQGFVSQLTQPGSVAPTLHGDLPVPGPRRRRAFGD
jgi:hypothetical protein